MQGRLVEQLLPVEAWSRPSSVATYHVGMAFFDSAVYAKRRDALREAARSAKCGGVVLGTGGEFEYLTGCRAFSHERLTAYLLGGDGQACIVAPITDIETLMTQGSIDGVDVVGWRDGQDPYALVAQHVGRREVYLGPTLTADHVFALQNRLDSTQLLSDVVSRVFTVKDGLETQQLSRAAAAIDRVHARVPELLKAGVTEADVAARLHALILHEHVNADFIIVGSGPNGANPHHEYSERVLKAGEPVVVDIGGTLDSGYRSDCTRTYVVDGATPLPEVETAYDVLQQAQAAARAAAAPGILAGELDRIARDCIASAGYKDAFTHRLGHGIGLSTHEPPFITDGSDTVLEAGMVFSIEPGIYMPGKWGMRVEDIVRLDAAGAKALNTVSRTLR